MGPIGYTRKGVPVWPIAGGDGTTALIEQVSAARKVRLGDMEQLTQKLLDDKRAKFSEDEQRAWDGIVADLTSLDTRISDLREAFKSESTAGAAVSQRDRELAANRVGGEARTYTKESARSGANFLRDLVRKDKDPYSAERLAKHSREYADGLPEERAGTTGSYVGLTVPQFLIDMVAPLRRAGRPLANICNGHELPEQGMVLDISRITTGSIASIQASEGGAVASQDISDTLLTVPVRTIAGMQDVSRQAIDRSTGTDDLIIADLMRAYNTQVDNQVISGSGAAGQHLGIRNVSGIIAVTFTNGAPTVALEWPSLWNLVQQVQSGVFLGVSHFVMHPRRFWWHVASVGTSFPFLQVFDGATNGPAAAGNVEGTGSYESGFAGRLGPIPVVLDANIPTNLGAGTNQDDILGVTAGELHLWEDPNAPLFITTEQVLANNLQVRFVLYGYSAFTAGRYPAAQGSIDGTGLITPTF
jgi:HK97 family phage major capsid protein